MLFPLVKKEKIFCSQCNPVTKLCSKCDYDNILLPDKNGGCEKTTKCRYGENQCIQCEESGTFCIKCIEGYFPDINGGCSYTDHCEISYNGICIKCVEDFILIGEEIKICKSLINGDLAKCERVNTKNGWCQKCIKGYYLSVSDKRCTNELYCSESTFGICKKCIYGYYLDKKEGKCKQKKSEIFEHCQQSIDGETCDICDTGFYFDNYGNCVEMNFCSKSLNSKECQECNSEYYLTDSKNLCISTPNCQTGNKDTGICTSCIQNYYIDYSDGKCKSNLEDNEFIYCKEADEVCKQCIDNYFIGKDGKCSNDKNCAFSEKGICLECIDNFYLGSDNKCSLIKGCLKSENENKCIECNINYCLNSKTGNCENNQNIYTEAEKIYYKCKKTNEEGNKCEICLEGLSLNNNGLCFDDTHCLEKNNNICLRCQNNEKGSYCLNKNFGCLEMINNENCLECDNILNLSKCTKCIEGYEENENGKCIKY